MKKKYITIAWSCLLFISGTDLTGRSRSPLRTPDPGLPKISTQWAHKLNGKKHVISDSHIEEYPLFNIFNENHFKKNILPHNVITYRHDSHKTVDGGVLNKLCEQLLAEVRKKKRHFTSFKVLQRKNFNRKHMCGLLVVKFRDYPFVVKLFIETPKTFINYWWKGFEPIFFWNMGRGAGRHLSGLTRIRNREVIEQRLQKDPFEDITIQMPRKWFWEPKNNKYIKITGTNINNKKEINTQLPGVYAIIADAINTKQTIDLPTKEQKRIAMKLCSHLNLIIDPHTTNFIFKRNTNNKKINITLIDTEYFPVMVGLKEKKKFDTHGEWYLYLTGKCLQDTFGRTKRTRRNACSEKNELLFTYLDDQQCQPRCHLVSAEIPASPLGVLQPSQARS